MIEDSMTLAQAIESAGVSEKTLRRWIKSGRLTAELIEGPKGKEYRIKAADLAQSRRSAEKKDGSEPRTATIETGLEPNDLDKLKFLAEKQTAMIEALRVEVRNLVDQNHDLTAQVSQLQDRVIKALPAPATRPTLWERFKSWGKRR